MKNLRTTTLCVCLTLYSLCSSAQNQKIPINEPDYNKPKLFENLPDKIPVSLDNITSLFNSSVGRPVNISLAEGRQFQFEGQVVSTASKFENTLQSIVVRSTNYNGATLTVSRITSPEGIVTYTGRIISFQHGDLYELQNKDGIYTLVKRNFYDLVNE